MALPSSQPPLAYDEIVEMLAATNPAQIIAFKPSEEACRRVSELLEKNRQGTLTPEEGAELDQFGHIEHLMRLVKARARQYLSH